MKNIVICLLLMGLMPEASANVKCSPMDAKQFNEHLNQKKNLDVIFFASWCSACKTHLSQPHSASSILVASFDEKGRAEEALSFLKIKDIPCIYDKENSIAKSLGVTNLPKQLSLTALSKKRG